MRRPVVVVGERQVVWCVEGVGDGIVVVFEGWEEEVRPEALECRPSWTSTGCCSGVVVVVVVAAAVVAHILRDAAFCCVVDALSSALLLAA